MTRNLQQICINNFLWVFPFQRLDFEEPFSLIFLIEVYFWQCIHNWMDFRWSSIRVYDVLTIFVFLSLLFCCLTLQNSAYEIMTLLDYLYRGITWRLVQIIGINEWFYRSLWMLRQVSASLCCYVYQCFCSISCLQRGHYWSFDYLLVSKESLLSINPAFPHSRPSKWVVSSRLLTVSDD